MLQETRKLLQGKGCQADCLASLNLFGYVENGNICVPVFSPEDMPAIEHLASLAEAYLDAEVERTLLEALDNLNVTAVLHGVPPKEIANELYHVLFGGINEEAVKRGLVAAPPDKPGEGRYLKCIEY